MCLWSHLFPPQSNFKKICLNIKLQVETMEERLAYTFLNLLADFGGYLGMFVGGNLLAILDIIKDRSIF